jgi:hypothetical protein
MISSCEKIRKADSRQPSSYPYVETDATELPECDLLVLLLTPSTEDLSHLQRSILEMARSGKLVVALIHPEAPWDSYGMLEGLTYIPLEIDRPRHAVESVVWNISKLDETDQRTVQAVYALATLALTAFTLSG